jgi:alpha-tubulin suppressor-like RCC1 family protein
MGVSIRARAGGLVIAVLLVIASALTVLAEDARAIDPTPIPGALPLSAMASTPPEALTAAGGILDRSRGSLPGVPGWLAAAPPAAIAVAAGGYHTCALLADGSVRCWGLNSDGQLGDGTSQILRLTPVAVSGMSTATAIAAGGYHSCALLADGSVRCWGLNFDGQLGDGTRSDRSTAVKVVGIGTAVAITAGSSHTCALLADGSVRCWGLNYFGQLGDGAGTYRSSTPVQAYGITTAVAVAAGGAFGHTCAVLADHTARCWGWNFDGELGDGTTIDSPTPVTVTGIGTAIAIAAGGSHSCALLADGTARCWGDNHHGQLGDEESDLFEHPLPVEVDAIATATAAGGPWGHTCAVLADGSARCWGFNDSGQLGDGTTTDRLTPVDVVFPLDTTQPTGTLAAPASPTSSATLSYTVTFSEPVTGLTASDFTWTGTAAGCRVNAPAGAGASYTVTVTGCSDGTIGLSLHASTVTDASGNPGPPSAVAAATVVVDTTPPTATAPAAALRSGVSLVGSAIPVRLAWKGLDTGGSGIARYELARSTNGGTTWTTASSSLASPAASVTVPASGTVRFRVRAVDRAENTGAWATGPTLSPRLVQQTKAAIRYTGTWRTASSAKYSGGSVKYAKARGASARYTFTGRSIALVTAKAPTMGKVRVYVNGTLVATVNLYASAITYRALAWQTTWPTSATRTIKLVVVGTTGRPRVDLDAFVVLK